VLRAPLSFFALVVFFVLIGRRGRRSPESKRKQL
jgi:hypothetical protein